MQKIKNIKLAQMNVLKDMNALFHTIREHSKSEVYDLGDGLYRMRRVRSAVYEDLNQIQHEYLILQGMIWLRANDYEDPNIDWYWNPRQTGTSTEPDLRGILDTEIVVSAEASTSEEPQGKIDSRMRDTLTKLNKMVGQMCVFAPKFEPKSVYVCTRN